jgi:hypothetical protein
MRRHSAPTRRRRPAPSFPACRPRSTSRSVGGLDIAPKGPLRPFSRWVLGQLDVPT